jgi:hypothetical protein
MNLLLQIIARSFVASRGGDDDIPGSRCRPSGIYLQLMEWKSSCGILLLHKPCRYDGTATKACIGDIALITLGLPPPSLWDALFPDGIFHHFILDEVLAAVC